MQNNKRNEKFSGNLVTPDLHFIGRHRYRSHIGQRRFTEPYMSQFMGQREHLRRFGIFSIYENQRRQRVGECKPSKLLWIERAMGIAADNAAHHDHYADGISLRNETTQSFGPGRHATALLHVESKGFTNAPGNLNNIALQRNGTDERQRDFPHGPREVLVPFLALLTYIHCVQQVRARIPDMFVADSTKIRNRHRLFRRLRQKKVTKRGVRSLSKMFQLPEGGARLAAYPSGQFAKRLLLRQRIDALPGTFTSP